MIRLQNHSFDFKDMFNYKEVLKNAILFYEAQRSGRLPQNNRVAWRKNSALNDGADVGVDLTGGWYDAGDYMKFGFPFAATVTMLAWGVIEYRAAYVNSGQLVYLADNLKWATDYLLKAYRPVTSDSTVNDVFYGQVGKTELDHNWWGPPERMLMERPAYKITSRQPGSDLAAESAAAMAACSIVFRIGSNRNYADLLLSRAERLYRFGDEYRGIYSESITDARESYPSTGFEDELVWAALWLHKARLAQGGNYDGFYLVEAERYYNEFNLEGHSGWTQSWDDKIYGAYILLSQLTNKPQYKQDAENFLNWWTPSMATSGVTYSPGGQAWLDRWGSLRYSANTVLLAFIYSDWLRATGSDENQVSRYHQFAVGQINYILGNNPLGRSFVTGFGSNPPKRPHHASSHCSLTNNINYPIEQRFQLIGAMVGGPEAPDDFSVHLENRSNYISNEVACDYNAGLVGALARISSEFNA